MNRNELIERIRDALIDPWTDPDNYYNLAPATLADAREALADIREDERLAELDDDERLPAEVTPELVQEVMNCLIRWRKHEHQVEQLAEWLTDNECVCIYDQYRDCYPNNSPEVIPVDFLYNADQFPFALEIKNAEADVVTMLSIGAKSVKTFSTNHNYCWFDQKKWQLYSTDTPFADGIINAKALATYAIDSGDPELMSDLRSQMDDDDWNRIFPEN